MRHVKLPLHPEQAFAVSASQLESFAKCKRRWGFAYVAGLREPTTVAQQIGLNLHKQIEDYYVAGKVPDKRIREAFRAGIYPYREHAKKLSVVVEGSWKEALGKHGYVYYVKPDLWSPVSMTVWDHKTTGNIEGDYVLRSAKKMLNTVQPLIYAKAALDAHPERDAVNMVWVYYDTKRLELDALYSQHTLSRDEVDERFASTVEPLAVDLVTGGHAAVKQVAELDDQAKIDYVNRTLEPNEDACWAYNQQCPHKARCVLTDPATKVVDFFAQQYAEIFGSSQTSQLTIQQTEQKKGKKK